VGKITEGKVLKLPVAPACLALAFKQNCALTLPVFKVMMCIPFTAEKGRILKNVSMMAFLKMDMKHKIIHSINLPELDENHYLTTFKVMHLEICI
jgi:hypothetical protein